MSGTVEKNCLACGDLIHVRVADHKRGWGKFCDKSCAAAHKSGMRPGDVNAYHAKCQGGYGWAAKKLKDFAAYPDGKPPKARRIKDQLTKSDRKVNPVYHSPAFCVDCGAKINGPGRCDPCEAHHDAMNWPEGWDGHKS